MAFDWADYLVFAEELAQRSDEAALRSAMSRAYYAAFCTARNRLRQDHPYFEKERQALDSHKRVWDVYRNDTHEPRHSIGEVGDRLRKKRRLADYEDEVRGLPKLARDTTAKARRLLDWLDSLGNAGP